MNAQKHTELLAAYLVNGTDLLKREAVMKRLRIRLETFGDLSFNADEFEGAGGDGGAIVSACRTVPFASEKRLVTVKDADKLPKKASEALVEYLADPSDTTVLLLVCDSLAKNTRLFKAMSALGKNAIIDCAPPKRYELANQVRSMAVTHGITLTPQASETLVELVGEDTLRLDGELKKLAVSHQGPDPLDMADIKGLVAQAAEVKPWDFIDAFSARDLKACIEMLPLMPSMTPYGLLGRCVGRIRELICAKSMLSSGGNIKAHIAKALSLPDWKVKNHEQWAQRFTEEELRDAIFQAARAERAMKSGVDPQSAFKDWMIEVLR